ncbi:uncharacterized protein LOC133336547 [Musca vetustissima]|uniref:uncharacterized protein LOC133336547 n=1 Tax=Musca vetustissima TaxID=27455 RepID=UPI002AB7ADE8|nr:uncharacterized protein LOC133336547 [Musca vetustissima]
MYEQALGPLNLVRDSELKELAKPPPLDIEGLAVILEDIVQTAAGYINADPDGEFLYKNPNGWKRNSKKTKLENEINDNSSDSFTMPSTSSSSSSDASSRMPQEPWCLLQDFNFPSVVRQITQFIENWELTPATKFVVIAQEMSAEIPPFGKRYFVEAHFSKPTPQCPNPLAIAKVFFHINVCDLLPRDYPINVIYQFENHRGRYYALGAKKLNSNNFQKYFIDTLLHMKLAFYAELEECRQVHGVKE